MKTVRTIDDNNFYGTLQHTRIKGTLLADIYLHLRKLKLKYHKTKDVNKKLDIYIDFCDTEFFYLQTLYERKKEISKIYENMTEIELNSPYEEELFYEDRFILDELEKHNVAPPRAKIACDDLETLMKEVGCAIIRQAVEDGDKEYLSNGIDQTVLEYGLEIDTELIKGKYR